MIQPVALVSGIAGQVHAQPAEGVVVHCGQDDRGMNFAVLQLRQLAQCPGGVVVGGRGNGQGDQHLIRMQAGVVIAQILALQFLNGFDNLGRNQVRLLRNPRQLLQCVQEHRGGGPKQFCGLAGNDVPVRELDCQGRIAGCLGAGEIIACGILGLLLWRSLKNIPQIRNMK